jgi:hypothetical protein
MNYLLTCSRCNTNLKDFVTNYCNNNKNVLHCICPPNDMYVICSGIYIYYNNDEAIIQLCSLDEKDDYLEDNIYYLLNTNELFSNNFSHKILIDLQGLELIDYMYKLYLKYKENEIFA